MLTRRLVLAMAHCRDVLTKGCVPPMEEKRKVLVDFSSPNIAKEMHVRPSSSSSLCL